MVLAVDARDALGNPHLTVLADPLCTSDTRGLQIALTRLHLALDIKIAPPSTIGQYALALLRETSTNLAKRTLQNDHSSKSNDDVPTLHMFTNATISYIISTATLEPYPFHTYAHDIAALELTGLCTMLNSVLGSSLQVSVDLCIPASAGTDAVTLVLMCQPRMIPSFFTGQLVAPTTLSVLQSVRTASIVEDMMAGTPHMTWGNAILDDLLRGVRNAQGAMLCSARRREQDVGRGGGQSAAFVLIPGQVRRTPEVALLREISCADHLLPVPLPVQDTARDACDKTRIGEENVHTNAVAGFLEGMVVEDLKSCKWAKGGSERLRVGGSDVRRVRFQIHPSQCAPEAD